MTLCKTSTAAAALMSLALPALADGELNLYSSRHYDTDVWKPRARTPRRMFC